MGDLILGAILQYMVSASFSCFLWSVKGYGIISGLFNVLARQSSRMWIETPVVCKHG